MKEKMDLLHKRFSTGPIQAQKGSITMKDVRNVLANAFSISMIADMVWEDKGDNFAGLSISEKEVKPDAIPTEVYSVVGHDDTARVIGTILRHHIRGPVYWA